MSETGVHLGPPAALDLESVLLKASVLEFFEYEYDLLDQRELGAWLDLLHSDIKYTVPIQRNVKFAEWERETVGVGDLDVSWIADDKATLRARVEQLQTGVHWAEEPVSRSAHLITNVRILGHEVGEDGTDHIWTRSRFLLYRNRVQREVDLFVGLREDTLQRRDGVWQILERTVFIEQNVLLSKNFTLFF